MARHLKKLLCIVLVVFMLVGCAPTSPSTIAYNSIEKVEERLAQYSLGKQYDDQTLLKWLNNFYRRFFTQQFKRSCLPDGPKVGSVTLSPCAYSARR